MTKLQQERNPLKEAVEVGVSIRVGFLNRVALRIDDTNTGASVLVMGFEVQRLIDALTTANHRRERFGLEQDEAMAEYERQKATRRRRKSK